MIPWQEYAACKNEPLEIFFEKYEDDKDTAINTDDMCFDCPVREACLKFGVEHSSTGVFGATYLVFGKFSRARNSHKLPYINYKLQKEVAKLRENHGQRK